MAELEEAFGNYGVAIANVREALRILEGDLQEGESQRQEAGVEDLQGLVDAIYDRAYELFQAMIAVPEGTIDRDAQYYLYYVVRPAPDMKVRGAHGIPLTGDVQEWIDELWDLYQKINPTRLRREAGLGPSWMDPADVEQLVGTPRPTTLRDIENSDYWTRVFANWIAYTQDASVQQAWSDYQADPSDENREALKAAGPSGDLRNDFYTVIGTVKDGLKARG